MKTTDNQNAATRPSSPQHIGDGGRNRDRDRDPQVDRDGDGDGDGDCLLDQVASRPVQTLARAFDQICQGIGPWIALNEFFHEWYDYAKDHRPALVATPIGVRSPRDVPANEPANEPDLWRWAVFCAAAADYLCTRYSVPCPGWSEDPVYVLLDPWYSFGDLGAQSPARRDYLEYTTPPELRRRNVIGGGRIFANKYEFAALVKHLCASGGRACESGEVPDPGTVGSSGK